jgi:SAM-dependent methyltransferase
VAAVAADFLEAGDLGRFDLVSLNKVIEHVADPVAMLARAAGHLAPGGLVYCEVPDAPAAAAEGPGREEFFIEHLHVFSPASLAMAAARAGLSPVRMERLHEPSGKWTIAAFLAVAP